jgi:hypothetical protein
MGSLPSPHIAPAERRLLRIVRYVEDDDVKPGLEEDGLYSASFYPDSGGFSLVVAWFSLKG